MNIAFFSEDNFGLEVLKDVIKIHFVKAVICPYFENNIHQRLESFCQKNNILFYRTKNINDEYVKNAIFDNVDLIISCHCSKIISKEVFTIPKFGAINLHPSLLPKYRGMAPQHWPIINGDEKTGVTVHYIAENVDTGNILYQKEIPIEKTETVFELQRKMIPFYKEGISLSLEKIQNGDKGTPQSLMQCIYYGRFYPEYAEINLRQTKKQVFDLVRAVTHPYFGASFSNIIVWKVSYIDSEQEEILMAKKTRFGFFYLDDIYYLRVCDGVLKVEDYSIYK